MVLFLWTWKEHYFFREKNYQVVLQLVKIFVRNSKSNIAL